GCEFAQGVEWNDTNTLDWYVLDYKTHQGIQKLVIDLNFLYRSSKALYQYEFDWQGFEWIDCHDSDQSILAYLRKSDDQILVVIVNFTPVTRYNYRVGVPYSGEYKEILNSDSTYYGGSNAGNGSNALIADEIAWMNHAHSLSLILPPLGCIVLGLQ
ncbi:MAG: alpha amylase C-terminal domain-containing protein, partial [Gammaproteobacteria bacterium]|nr:alpha amylase C-terminal domain-containing protein [Gammaproteobacteria bacterium]